MRLIPGSKYCFLVLLFFLSFVFPAFSQDLRQKVTLKMTGKPISEILEEISRQTKGKEQAGCPGTR
jgi:hypothetical protein